MGTTLMRKLRLLEELVLAQKSSAIRVRPAFGLLPSYPLSETISEAEQDRYQPKRRIHKSPRHRGFLSASRRCDSEDSVECCGNEGESQYAKN
jgi:hypothetical protein